MIQTCDKSMLRRRFAGRIGLFLVAFAGLYWSSFTLAQVPALLNYQGRIAVGTTVFDGVGQFKVALVNGDASQIYWLNSADGDGNGEPDSGVSITVTAGLYSLILGDTTVPNMAALPETVFSNSEVYLRVWFNDGVNGFQHLSPDQRVTSVGYAMISGDVPDGTVTNAKLGSDIASQLADLTSRLQQVEDSTTSGLTVVSTDSQDAGLIAKGFQSFSSTTAAPWIAGSVSGVPSARIGHTAVWSGQEMVVWGGFLGGETYANSGGRYEPGGDLWTTVTTFAAPTARQSHSGIWTSTEMIVWGGFGTSGYLNTGGRYQPTSQLWNAVTTTDAPSARSDHSYVWTGNRMIIWGGRSTTGYLSDGGLYDPAANQWTALTLPSPPESRHSATAVWSGDRMIVWGGEAAAGPVNSGGRLVVDTSGAPQQWEAAATANAPSARIGHSAVWTGSKMIIWGGQNGDSFFSDGALYDPVANTWTALPISGAPSARSGHVALWTGTEMLVYGGEDASGALSSGGAYDVAANKWRSLNTVGSPVARANAGAVWSGTELLVFGGESGGQPIASLQRLNPQAAWHFYRKL